MTEWLTVLIYFVLAGLILAAIIMSIVSLSTTDETSIQSFATSSTDGDIQTIDTLTVKGLLTSPEILISNFTTESSDITPTVEDGYEEVGNLVMDETSSGTTAIRPNFFSNPNRVIVTNGWLRAKVTDLEVVETSTEITMASVDKPLYTYVDRMFVDGVELIASGGAKGQKGEVGDDGPKGAVGPDGDQGEAGEKGATGATGEKGIDGETGLDGTNGAAGDKGATGADGTAGVKGEKGSAIQIDNIYATTVDLLAETIFPPDGYYAVAADDGTLYRSDGSSYTFAVDLQIEGEDGATGQKGDDGIKGEKGATGVDGLSGAQGEAGPKGEVGLAGPTGTQGDKGQPGSKGTQGSTGAQGDAGLKGNDAAIDLAVFKDSARMTYTIVQDAANRSINIQIDSPIWHYDTMPVWWLTVPSLVEPSFDDIRILGLLIEVGINDISSDPGYDLGPVSSPIYLGYSDGTQQIVSGPYNNGASNVITFGAQANAPFVSGQINDIDPVATASSGLAVTYTSLTPTTCVVVNGNQYQMLAEGVCTIEATQSGDATYNEAVPVDQSFTLTI